MRVFALKLRHLVPLTVFAAACGDSTPAPPAATSAKPSATVAAAPAPTASVAKAPAKPKPLNVLLLTVDSMRADMPWQGYDRPIAPNLTKLAKESTVYTRAYTVSSYTAKSVGAMLSGKYPSSLYRGGTFFTHYSDANEWFTERLQKEGIVTMAGHGHKYFDRGKNLRQGFDVWRITPGIKWNSTTDESVTSEKMTDMAIDMIKTRKTPSKPFFLWLHYMDPHDQYVVHEGTPKFGKSSRDKYDAEVHFTDGHIGRLLDFAKTQAWWKDTAVIISADHGEAFGEHGMHRHGFALWDVLTHVPLIVKVPGAKPQRIEERRSQVDLAPTILEMMGAPPSKGHVGKSLLAEVRGETKPDNREPIVLDLPADTNNPPTQAILAGQHKMIHDVTARRYRLYHLGNDPKEKSDLGKAKRKSDDFKKMKALFDATWAKIPQVTPYGMNKLVGGGRADGPKGPPGFTEPAKAKPKK